MKQICPLINKKCIEEKCVFTFRCSAKNCKKKHCLIREGFATLVRMAENFEGDVDYIG